ncbi:MAG: hypothetical protein WEB04_08875 [Dehalococcoidia bacterium]
MLTTEAVATEDEVCADHPDDACDVLKYFIALYDVRAQAEAAINAELEYIAPTLTPDASGDDYRAVAQEGIFRTRVYIESMIQGLEQLTPPPPLVEAHSQYLDAYSQSLRLGEEASAIMDMEDVDTFEEVRSAFDTLLLATDVLNKVACEALVDVADRYNVRSGLDCNQPE